jgi:hypothetical protein
MSGKTWMRGMIVGSVLALPAFSGCGDNGPPATGPTSPSGSPPATGGSITDSAKDGAGSAESGLGKGLPAGRAAAPK